jgi:hypothetical protein
MNRRRLLRLIGKEPPVPVLVTEDQGANDIIKRMALKHKKCAPEYDAICFEFSDGSINQICERLFDFCKSNIYYSEESIDVQSISAPQTILARGHCDCKGYALFIAGVLDGLKRAGHDINWCFRFASYKIFDETPGHVFVVVDPGTISEIWVDPVLKRFNDHKDYCHHIDRKVKTEAKKIGCADCGGKCQSVGSVAQTGQLLEKISPELAVVPVVGWVAAAAGTVVGFFLSVFGSKYNTSTGVRYLDQRFEYYVLGLKGSTNDRNVNESNVPNAQKWFSYVLGVPIYDQYRYHALRGSDPNTGRYIPGITRQQRAQNYIASAPDAVQAGVTLSDALAATYNADKFDETDPAGGWAGFTAAPSLVNSETATMSVDASGNLVSSGTATTGNRNLILIGAVILAAYLILK